MIWLTWRQLRTRATQTFAALAVLALVLATTGPRLAHLHTTAGRGLVQQLTGTDTALYFAGGVAVLVLPALVGMFWGAPSSPASWRPAPTGSSGTRASPEPAGC